VIAKVEQIHTLITDIGAPKHAVDAMQRRGVEVRLV
jgi:DeoR/GlpR family transcriptional regulator of sugar metabolism